LCGESREKGQGVQTLPVSDVRAIQGDMINRPMPGRLPQVRVVIEIVPDAQEPFRREVAVDQGEMGPERVLRSLDTGLEAEQALMQLKQGMAGFKRGGADVAGFSLVAGLAEKEPVCTDVKRGHAVKGFPELMDKDPDVLPGDKRPGAKGDMRRIGQGLIIAGQPAEGAPQRLDLRPDMGWRDRDDNDPNGAHVSPASARAEGRGSRVDG